jgi:putative ABC transport system permease protein
VNLHRALLRLYPASFRDEYGREMQAIFARRWRLASHPLDRMMVLVGACADVLCNAPAAHLDIARQDLATAWQTIRRARMLSATVVVVTAIGIGATTAAFAVADHVLIRPLPYYEPDRLVKIWQADLNGGRSEASPANYRDWRDNARSFERIAAYQPVSRNLVGVGAPVRLEGASVTGELFATLGVTPLLGRTITSGDDRETSPLTVVISERLWRTRFAADATVVGRAVALDDAAHVIIGVMPARFEFPTRLVDFWIPQVLRSDQYVYGNPFLNTVARLKPGGSREQADAEVRAISSAIARANPQANARQFGVALSMRDEVAPQSRSLLLILAAAAASLLLIACTNLANLLLTRGLARQKEFAVRAALGAGRRRLVRQLFTEHALLAACGGVAGAGLALAGIPTLVRLVPTSLPAAEAPTVDVRLLLFAMAITIVTALAFGAVPAWRISGQSDARALHGGVRAGTSRRTARLRSSFVIAQVSLSVLLLIGCGLLLKAMLKVQSTDPGFRADRVLTLRTTLAVKKYESVRLRHQFFTRVIDAVQALPGVTSAAYVSGLPMVQRGGIWVINVVGYEQVPGDGRLASLRLVTPRFFETLAIPLRSGRDFADSDTQGSLPVAVVSESFARQYWPGQSALGRQFTIRGIEWTIVGVVGDIRFRGLERRSEAQLYLAEQQMPDRGLSAYVPRDLVIKSERSLDALLPAIRSIIASADPQQPISDIQRLTDIVVGETAPRRVQVRVLGIFALIAFLLAGIGLHGLLSYTVSQGSREIGVRMALGAEQRTILGMVMRNGMQLAIAGVIVGSVLAMAAGRWLQALLAGVSPTDFASFGGAVVLALGMTALGSLLPALKAIRVDPLQVIRAE